ncbi:MAG: ABC transporter ATP-binding protein [Planctomycetales bacterium]|nr:ABC transporter ATP-binding protein [Planctomycetales bacterium]
METVLSVRDLRTYFRSDDGVVKAVDGVSFDVRKGETLGIVGESGSGKSVTCLSVMRLNPEPPGFYPSGQILMGGRDTLRLSERELLKLRGNQVSMIFQDPMTSLNPLLRVSRQLTEVLEVHRGMSRGAARQRAIEMLHRVGLPDAERRIDQYPHQFSGGMRQRVMIAMALLCEPELLIADEPTTALDVTIQAQILELIQTLQRESGTSVILITHDLGVVAGVTDRLAVMYAGRIVEAGPTDEVFANPQHPYTRGLMHSVPRLDVSSHAALEGIPGLPPDLSNLPTGCPFHPRCPLATTRCQSDYPNVVSISDQHWSACWENEQANQ